MEEANLNTAIKNLVEAGGGWAQKWPDPPKAVAMMSTERPFDGSGVIGGFHFSWEGKFDKGYSAFNFNRVADHQYLNLEKIVANGGNGWVVLGVWESRKFFDVFVFDVRLLSSKKREGKKSFLKKELLALKEAGWFTPLLRGRGATPALFEELQQKFINEETFDRETETCRLLGKNKKKK